MSDEFSYKQIAFDFYTKKGEHFHRNNMCNSKLKNTILKEGELFMIKMEIVLDDEKMYEDGGHDKLVEVYTYVDQVAVGYNLILQPIENGRLVYNARNRADDCSYVGLTYLKLVESKEFMKYCKEWLWIEINKDGKTIVENILKSLEQEKQKEALL